MLSRSVYIHRHRKSQSEGSVKSGDRWKWVECDDNPPGKSRQTRIASTASNKTVRGTPLTLQAWIGNEANPYCSWKKNWCLSLSGRR